MTRITVLRGDSAARVSAAVGTFVLVATVVLWWLLVADVHTAFADLLLGTGHLVWVISFMAGGAVLTTGLALRALLASEQLPRSRALAKIALTCVIVAVLIALTPFAIVRGRG